ncbi:hypothetical protein AX17_006809 [Amanita inopinata Kibby_2008]|nr:hypothetical protein AX17_006809 [Amanita inopinata Kibby_2008]
MSIRYLTARLAQQIDEELMSAGTTGASFSLDQLMELAGLACAQTLARVYTKDRFPRVLVCCGPGNQGGDGLVAARHLGMFGYRPMVYLPKVGEKEIYRRLVRQCESMRIPILTSPSPSEKEKGKEKETETETASLVDALGSSDVILDAIFGFSFKPPVRPPFDEALWLLGRSGLPIVSVDIPSGWDVELGNVNVNEGVGLRPDVLVSLTAPKVGVRGFGGRHFLGGRFVPRTLEEKYALNLPEYPGSDQIVELVEVEAQESGEEVQKL